VVNLLNAKGYGEAVPNRGVTLEALAKQGAQFGVCALSTRALAGSIAHAAGSTTEAILAELTANLVTNARLVPAGVVAVSRAQERGYTLVSC
jgi:intracellular sulfur oxidation DsrE/DsrF family protein